ncbi:MAG TPA: hypothetical protein VHZ73_09250 [Vicinamibacterales bacterium]|jgi:hypothetical protein|nr:hypothetical protein [Vicinamibacterales bacterium]
MKLRALVFTLVVATTTLTTAALHAQGRHPHYLTARSDLRTASLYLHVREEPNVTRNLRTADTEVGAAIGELDRAAVLDRKDVDDHPRIDERLERRDRFRKVVDLLRGAKDDIDHEEDNPRAREWRNRATHHIDEALNAVHRAAVDAHLDHEIGF